MTRKTNKIEAKGNLSKRKENKNARKNETINQTLVNDIADIKMKQENISSLTKNFEVIKEEKDEIPFKKRIESLLENHAIIKDKFLNTDLSKLKVDADNYSQFILKISEFYYQLCYFPDLECKDRFKFWGLPKAKLNWMIPLNEITEEINKIGNDDRFAIQKEMVFVLITQHLHDKIYSEVLKWFRLTAPLKLDLDIEKYLQQFSRRLNDGGGKLKSIKNIGETILQKQIQKLRERFPDPMTFMINKVRGNTEKLLGTILSSTIQFSEISESEYFCCMFNLFKIICKDKQMLSEKEFEERNTKRRQEKKEPFYNDDYNFYRYRVIKKLVFKE